MFKCIMWIYFACAFFLTTINTYLMKKKLSYRQHMMQYVLREYVSLLTEERFHDVDFTVVRDHIPFMGELMF